MPTIFFHCPKLDENQKKAAVTKLTDAASEVTGIDRHSFVVYLEEKDPVNVGVGGELLRDVLKNR
ncbi:MAG TPA: 4-oxalocrotonate tautomerase DmpI [Acidobacteriota bacterium]|nr:4-oxalocrotonate tautomerase DmpI [Acidobacteriota bacterium]